MRDFIKKKLNEDLQYWSANNANKDSYKLGIEEISVPKLRISKDIKISPEDIEKIKNVSWENLQIIENGDDGNSILHFNLIIPNTNKEIGENVIVDVQLVHNILYQVHINLPKAAQKMGLGYKVYVAMVNYLGQIYSGKGRILNPDAIPQLWNKLNNEPGIDCHSGELGTVCFSKHVSNEDKESILKFF